MPAQLNAGSNKLAVKKPSGRIGETFEKPKKFARDGTRSKAIEDLIVETVVPDDQPFTIIVEAFLISLITWSLGLQLRVAAAFL